MNIELAKKTLAPENFQGNSDLREVLGWIVDEVVRLTEIADEHFRLSTKARPSQRGMTAKEKSEFQLRLSNAGFNNSDIARLFGETDESVAQKVGRSRGLLDEQRQKRETTFTEVIGCLEKGMKFDETCASLRITPSQATNALSHFGKRYSDFAQARYERACAVVEEDLRVFMQKHELKTLSTADLQRYDRPMSAKAARLLPISKWRARLGLPEVLPRQFPAWLLNHTKPSAQFKLDGMRAALGPKASSFTIEDFASATQCSLVAAAQRVRAARGLGVVRFLRKDGTRLVLALAEKVED